MLNNRLSVRTAGKLSRGGFTLVELLVVIGIIAILAGVALGPITGGIEKAKQNAAMQNARAINLLLFQYSTDHDDKYPAGATSEAIAQTLLANKYATDPSIFSVAATKYSGTGGTFADFQKANIDWDFTAGANATTGITSSASDLIPTLYTHGSTVTYTKGDLTLGTDPESPFGLKGIAVAYKGNNAKFIKATVSGSGSVAVEFISPSYTDTASYTQVVP